MDEMKVKLSTKFMKGLVSKLISRIAYEKTGRKFNIQINDLDINVTGDNAKLITSIEVMLSNDELKELLKSIF